MTTYRYLRIASFYPTMFADYLSKTRGFEHMSYEQARDGFFFEAYGIGNFYELQLATLGNDTHTIIPGFAPLQEKWRVENGFRGRSAILTVMEQVARVQPDVIYIEDIFLFSEAELAQLRSLVPRLRVLYSFLGSDYTASTLQRMRGYDFILTCSDELADQFRTAGVVVHRILHAFEGAILNRLGARPRAPIPVTFLGALTSGEQFHAGRNEILHHLVNSGIDIKLFSTITQGTTHLRVGIEAVGRLTSAVSRIGYFRAFEELAIVRKVRSWVPRESMVVEPAVRARIRPPLFGLDMYEQLRASTVTFNSHIKNSRVASNMRLFEATGIGTCLLTDWRENMKDMFNDGTEVVTYTSKEDCREKVQWLVDHPEEAGQIAAAGQRRCLTDHSYARRAALLHEIICERLSH